MLKYMKRNVCVCIYMTQSRQASLSITNSRSLLCYTAIINNIVIQPYLNKILLKVNQEMLMQAS